MRNERFRFLASSLAAVCFGAGVVTLPGCGNSGPREIPRDQPATETMKESMDYMRQQYAKKGRSKKKSR